MIGHGHPIILIAEDNENDVLMLERAFRQAAIDLPLHVVADGEQAIAYLRGDGKFANRAEYPLPDLLLLDLKMPRKNGFEVLQWLRDQPTLASLRTVVLTTSNDIWDINRAYGLGANSFLVKPLDFTDFKDTIQAIYNYWLNLDRSPDVARPPLVNPYRVPPSSPE
jgi:CheY-like chemotaxis protein